MLIWRCGHYTALFGFPVSLSHTHTDFHLAILLNIMVSVNIGPGQQGEMHHQMRVSDSLNSDLNEAAVFVVLDNLQLGCSDSTSPQETSRFRLQQSTLFSATDGESEAH